MELNWLKYFYEVAQSGSITHASKKLRISQPAVTKMIKQLEGSLELPLFRKSGRKIVLTQEGRKLHELCIPIFRRLEGIKKLRSPLDQNTKEEIKLGASDNLCNYLLPNAISKFTKQYPGISWNLYSGTSHELKQKLLAGEIDYALFYTRLSLKELEWFEERKLFSVPFKLVCSSKLKEIRTVADINESKLHYLGARSSDYASTAPEQWIYTQIGLKPKQVFQSNSKETQKRFVLSGMGYGIFPEFMVQTELKKDLLKLVHAPQHKMTIDVLMVSRKNDVVSATFEQFLEGLK